KGVSYCDSVVLGAYGMIVLKCHKRKEYTVISGESDAVVAQASRLHPSFLLSLTMQARRLRYVLGGMTAAICHI
ncbi:hypothetical protein ACFL1X_13070, partial [Candidatus Hydrogenedentota bacterium]